jgi:hypothetical protein
MKIMENVARIIFLVKHGFQIGFQNLILYIDEVDFLLTGNLPDYFFHLILLIEVLGFILQSERQRSDFCCDNLDWF